MSPRSWRVRFQDMLGAIDRAVQFTSGVSFEEFKADQMRLLSVMMCINILGDAAGNLPEEIRLRYAEVPWAKIRGIRNRAAHEYFQFDEMILWNTCKEQLPVLKKQLQQILDRHASEL